VLRTIHRTNVSRLSEALEATETVLEFRFAPAG
jgi:hypothetical protein